ncbi:MAG: hypothetical protein ACK4R6_01160 [Spirosomataceae bacterium]
MKTKMGRWVLGIGILGALNAYSQEARVDSTTFGIQTGFLGIYAHNEARISPKIALRTEVGINAGIYGGAMYAKRIGTELTPVITVEPRWYYNLDKRVAKGKNISGNSGNFLTLQTSFNPSWQIFSTESLQRTASQITVMPMWGLKRNKGKHFTFEAGAGVGVGRYLGSSKPDNPYFLGVGLHLRVGYRF